MWLTAEVGEVPKFIFGFIFDLNLIKIIQQANIFHKNEFVCLFFLSQINSSSLRTFTPMIKSFQNKLWFILKNLS